MANQVDFKILPSDQFNVYSPQTRSDKIITYFTLLSKLRGDILAVGQEDDPNDIVSAYYSTVGGTQTLHLVKADGSEVTASYTISTSTETQNASTGILVGGELTASIGGTTFSISAGVGQIVSQAATSSGVSTIVTPISWDAFSAITPTNLTTQPFTYLYIDSVGALQQQATPFTDVQYKSSIIIGHLCHIDLATINLVTSDQNVAYGTPTRLLELIQTFGPIKKQGLTLSANGSNLRINRSAGEGFIIGSNYQIDQFDPDKIIISAKIPSLLCRIYRNGSGGYVFDNNGGSYYNNIDPTKYDNGSGTLQTVNNNQWTIQRLYTFPSAPDDIICYYGTQIYNSQGDAIDNIPYEPFSEAPITALNSIFLGYVIPRGGASNLSSLGDATFIQAGLFRGLGSGGGSTTNLKLEDLSDVVITSPQNQDFLFYNSTSQEWQNVAVGAFKTIAVASQSDVVADSYNDTLTLVAGSNVTITTSAVADTITISSTDQYVGTVTSVDMSVPTGFAISGNPITTSGTLALAFASGYSLPTTASQANWNTAYNDSITAFSYNTSTGVLTLTQQDAGTLTATVTLQPFSTTNLTEGTNLYFTTTRARQSLSAGTAISYDNSTGVITNSAPDQIVAITAGTGTSVTGTYPNFTISATGTGGTVTSVDLTAGTGISVSGGPITTSGSITVTNTAPDQIVSLTGAGTTSVSGTYPNFTITSNDQYVGTVTSIATTAPITGGTITTTGTIGITQSGTASDGYLSSTDWNTFNSKEPALAKGNLTETTSSVLTITGGTNAVIGSGTTIAVSQSSSTTSGYLSSTDWNTFNGKAGTSFTTISVSGQSNIVADSASDTLTIVSGTGVSITTDASTDTLTITNSAPDQVVSITGAGTTSVTGTYPSFTITSNDQYDGTVTSVDLTAGTGISVSGGPITTSGSITVTNTAPDQIVSLTGAGTTTITGTYPNFTISSDDQYDGTVTSVNLTAGDRIDVSGGPITTSGSITVTHGVADGADFITAEAFRDRVIADGGIFEALGEVAIAIGSLEDAASPTSTDYSGGTVLQNLAVDEFGHVLGIGAITLDTDDITEGSTNLYYTDARSRAALSAGTGISYDNSTGVITNSAPDQTVVLTGTGTTTITGAYPSFTINSDDQYDGTVTSVDLTAGTGISVSGGPITSSGSITVTNTAPDQTVVLTAGTGISTSGTYPNFTITNSAPDQTVVLTAGTGITTSGTYPNFTVTNSAPDQTVALTAGTGISVTGTYPNFTITNSSPSSGGTVTSIATTAPITGGTIISTGTIGITQSGAAADGYLSSTDWNTFNGKAGSSFTTIAVSGQSDIVADSANDTLTISAGTGITLTTAALTDTLTITNSAPDQVVSLTGAGTTVVTGTYPSFTITSNDQYDGTVTSVAALTLGTTGTDLSSTVANGTTTPVITLNVPTASATNRGALSSADWTTFNGKQSALTFTSPLVNTANTITINQSSSTTDGYLSSTDWNTFNGKASNSFTTIAVASQTSIVADSATDTLTLVAGAGISLTTDATTDTLTITNTAVTNIACFAAYTTQNLSLTTSGVEYTIDFDVESITNASFFTHSTTVDPEEITVLVAGKYEISMGYVAANGNSSIATVQGYVGINGVGVPSFSFLQLNTSTVGQYVSTGFNTYIYDLAVNDVITAIFFPAYVGGSTGTITINPSGYDGSSYITIKKIG